MPTRDEPAPQPLVATLERLRLATPGQVQSVAPRVRRLAGELPRFESIWVDALAQARILTPLQAQRLNAGRGDSLLVGPYVLARRLPSVGYAECYAARHLETHRDVRLLIARPPEGDRANLAPPLESLVEQSRLLSAPQLAPIFDAGLHAGMAWAASTPVGGKGAADWMVENGRFPPLVVVHIAHQMLAALADLERFDLVHGDLGAAGIVLQADGHVRLPQPGLRPIIRPAEGYAHHDLPPEGYDYLAPERIADGAPASTATEVYACGCVWWHLLAGRPPFAGGNTLAKLRAVHEACALDIRPLAPETPEPLASAIAACLAHDPAKRPPSIAALAQMLGEPLPNGAAHLARCLSPRTRPVGLSLARRRRSTSARPTARLAVAAVIGLVLTATVTWSLWRGRRAMPTAAASGGSASGGTAPRGYPASADRRVDSKDTKTRATPPGPAQRAPGTPYPVPAVPPAVAQVRYDEEIETREDLILPTGTICRLDHFDDLRDGQTIRGADDGRPLVEVPPAGLLVDRENVVIENIDFVWPESGTETANAPAAIIRVAAGRAELRGCSFQSGKPAAEQPPAIAWSDGASDRDAVATSELVLTDCIFAGVSTGVDVQVNRTASLRLANTLVLASGSLARLGRPWPADESLTVNLSHVTVRQCDSVLEFQYGKTDLAFGNVAILATDSVFAPAGGGGLMRFIGPRPTPSLLGSIAWSGQGSLLPPGAAVAIWRAPGRRPISIDEESIDAAGLVRSELEFAGAVTAGPAASRVTVWQAPLRSSQAPGINKKFDNVRR